MMFSSLTFLTVFLPLTIVLYFISSNRKYRNGVLMFVSLLFFSWGDPKYLTLMILTVIINYYLAIRIDKYRLEDPKKAKCIFLIALFVSLLSLIFFKYTNFGIRILNRVLNSNIPTLTFGLPLGISYYTFQIIAYLVDVHLGRIEVQRNLFDLMFYVSFFPKLVAGPIVKYATIENELHHRKESWSSFNLGVQRFILGLAKKIIIANNIAVAANYVFNTLELNKMTFTFAWIGVVAYTLQIYFDFSGYSDMAIGLGRMFGFTILENFNYPYFANSINDFWRRWHISLSLWFRDYVYIPLGGNRVNKSRWVINIFIVWFLTGLWHGANWNFILWGVYFGIILLLEKAFIGKILERTGVLRHAYTLLMIMIGWVFFNSYNVEQIVTIITHLFALPQGISFLAIKNARLLYLWPYFALGIFGATPIFKHLIEKLQSNLVGKIFYLSYLTLLVYLSIMFLISNSYNPFIYFKF